MKKTKKKKPPFEYNPKKFPNYPRMIKICWGPDVLCEITIRGYIHNFESKKKYVHYIIYDPTKGFHPKGKTKSKWQQPYKGEFPNFIRKLHIFFGHHCVAELDMRGFLIGFIPERTNVTIHTDHTVNYTGETKKN